MKPRPSGDVRAFALVNGRLAGSHGTTLNLSAGRPTAILIEDGKIAQLGDDDTVRGLAGRRGRAIDVGGAVIAPGIVDAHMHAFDCALASLRVSCLPPAVDSLTGLKRRLADRAGSRSPGAWVVATGYDDTRLREKRHPSRPALSSDAPCTSWDDPINPWLGIATAVARQTWAGSVLGTSQAVAAGEAMLCYTANGARALGLEKKLGAIATGKDADLIVLPRDPLAGEDPYAWPRCGQPPSSSGAR